MLLMEDSQKYNFADKLFDEILKIALEKAFEQEMEEMPSCEELNVKYKLSPALDKRIRKIISEYKSDT